MTLFSDIPPYAYVWKTISCRRVEEVSSPASWASIASFVFFLSSPHLALVQLQRSWKRILRRRPRCADNLFPAFNIQRSWSSAALGRGSFSEVGVTMRQEAKSTRQLLPSGQTERDALTASAVRFYERMWPNINSVSRINNRWKKKNILFFMVMADGRQN